MALDKTGTLTEGRMTVAAVVPAAGTTAEGVLRLAAAAESASEHPIARAIAQHGRRRLGQHRSRWKASSTGPGSGVEAVVEGRSRRRGPAGPAGGAGRELPSALVTEAERLEAAGATVVWVAVDGKVRA